MVCHTDVKALRTASCQCWKNGTLSSLGADQWRGEGSVLLAEGHGINLLQDLQWLEKNVRCATWGIPGQYYLYVCQRHLNHMLSIHTTAISNNGTTHQHFSIWTALCHSILFTQLKKGEKEIVLKWPSVSEVMPNKQRSSSCISFRDDKTPHCKSRTDNLLLKL